MAPSYPELRPCARSAARLRQRSSERNGKSRITHSLPCVLAGESLRPTGRHRAGGPWLLPHPFRAAGDPRNRRFLGQCGTCVTSATKAVPELMSGTDVSSVCSGRVSGTMAGWPRFGCARVSTVEQKADRAGRAPGAGCVRIWTDATSSTLAGLAAALARGRVGELTWRDPARSSTARSCSGPWARRRVARDDDPGRGGRRPASRRRGSSPLRRSPRPSGSPAPPSTATSTTSEGESSSRRGARGGRGPRSPRTPSASLARLGEDQRASRGMSTRFASINPVRSRCPPPSSYHHRCLAPSQHGRQ